MAMGKQKTKVVARPWARSATLRVTLSRAGGLQTNYTEIALHLLK